MKILKTIVRLTLIAGITMILLGLGMYMQAQQDAITLSKLMNESAANGFILKDNGNYYTVSYYNTNLNLSTIDTRNLTLSSCCNGSEIK